MNATQPARDADKLESTQPAADSGPACARFVRVGGRHGVQGPDQFLVLWEHAHKVELGRAGVTEPEKQGVTRVVLCDSNAQGVSRQHAWLRFDRQHGLQFTICASSTQAVTFINGQHLRANAPTIVLKDGDKLGFGGASVEGPDNNTIVYEAHFVDMPELIQIGGGGAGGGAPRARGGRAGAAAAEDGAVEGGGGEGGGGGGGGGAAQPGVGGRVARGGAGTARRDEARAGAP